MNKQNMLFYFLLVCTIFTTKTEQHLSQGQWMKIQEFYKDKKALVTGGCGFIGSHIATKLVELGAHVTIIDNLATGSHENIESIKNHVTFLNADVANFDACYSAVQGQNIIFHLAAFISVPQSLENPTLCYQTNVGGTFNILEVARRHNVQRLVFSSSAAVYGPRDELCSEDTPFNPQSPYGFSKVMGEQLCHQYRTSFNLRPAILRYFNVWGPRQDPNGEYAAVVAKFSHQMINNLPITIFGDGKQTRDFVHVSRVVEANLLLGMLAPTLEHTTFNVATGKSINLLELIDELKQDFPTYTGAIQFAPARPGDIKTSSANCARYQELLG